MSSKALAIALAATQIANTILRIQERVAIGEITAEEADRLAHEEWDKTAARAQSSSDRWKRIDAAVRQREDS